MEELLQLLSHRRWQALVPQLLDPEKPRGTLKVDVFTENEDGGEAVAYHIYGRSLEEREDVRAALNSAINKHMLLYDLEKLVKNKNNISDEEREQLKPLSEELGKLASSIKKPFFHADFDTEKPDGFRVVFFKPLKHETRPSGEFDGLVKKLKNLIAAEREFSGALPDSLKLVGLLKTHNIKVTVH